MYRTVVAENAVLFENIGGFDLEKSCTCGQSFRWVAVDGGFRGVAGGKQVLAHQLGNTLRLEPCSGEDAPFWAEYFDLARDYAPVEALLLGDARLAQCLPSAQGIRIFRQDPFETLISFILSANNNIKRISGIVERLCAAAGEDMGGYFAFPAPEAVCALSEQELAAIGAGYRARYVKSSAGLVAQGYDLEPLRDMPLDEARKALATFPGVGPKVADCVLLFSLGHMNAFPVDVWVGRALKTFFFEDETLPDRAAVRALVARLGPYSGIVQQYLFHHMRQSMGK